MGGINFGWLAVWVLSPDWLCHILELCDVSQAFSEAVVPGGGECGPSTDIASYTQAFVLQLRKIMDKPQTVNPKGDRLISAERDLFSRLGQRG
jgi:hypothetical protein